MSSKEHIFKVEGMTCASCVGVVESTRNKISGIEDINVNFATEKVHLKVNELFNLDDYKSLLSSLGYRLVDKNAELNEDVKDTSKLRSGIFNLLIGSFLMLLMLVPPFVYLNYIQLVLSTFSLFYFGGDYIKSVWSFFKSFHSNMNTLIGLGILSAYIYSILLMISNYKHAAHVHVYFEGIPFILGFTLLGKYFEELSKTKAKSALSNLYKMQIKFASKENKLTEEIENVAVVDLVKGDIIRVRPGDKVPIDGKIIKGYSHADESFISGESLPVVKKIGDSVFTGSLNLDGTLFIEVTHGLNETVISQIVSFVENAQLKKLTIQRYVDRLVQLFTPTVIVFSFVTFFIWFLFLDIGNYYSAITHLITVLLVACPCALGLAVPLAIMISTSNASKFGLLVSGGDVLENASSITTVVFDKTGTLTIGNPKVTEVHKLSQSDDDLKLALSVIEYSNHPLSLAIVKHYKENKFSLFDVDGFKNLPGLGMEALIGNKKILIGSEQLMSEGHIQIPADLSIDFLLGSLVYVAIDRKLAFVFVIFDPLKPNVDQLIASLVQLKKDVIMLTGDNEKIAKFVAQKVGIKNFKARVLPHQKAEFIEALKKSGMKVCMVGDGINDAQALSVADLSIAMANGSDIAVSTSSVSILEGKIELVANFFDISNRTMKVIKENLFFSFVYNIFALPIAAGFIKEIQLSPLIASLLMGISSISVILSSLRLRKVL